MIITNKLSGFFLLKIYTVDLFIGTGNYQFLDQCIFNPVLKQETLPLWTSLTPA